jgi:hypothetical protein
MTIGKEEALLKVGIKTFFSQGGTNLSEVVQMLLRLLAGYEDVIKVHDEEFICERP